MRYWIYPRRAGKSSILDQVRRYHEARAGNAPDPGEHDALLRVMLAGCACPVCHPLREEGDMSIIRGFIRCPKCKTENGSWRTRCKKCGAALKSSALPVRVNQPRDGW